MSKLTIGLLGGLLGAVGVFGAAGIAFAQPADPARAYPSQPVHIIVPFSAGSVTDILARSLGDKLSEVWHQPVIVENRPGIPGTAAAAAAAADGYTMALVSSGHSVIGSLNSNLPFDPVKDFAGVTKIASIPQVVNVPPSFRAKTLKELIAVAKDEPGVLNFASAGVGSSSFIAGEVFKRAAGIEMTHVPYKGAPDALTSVIRGDAQLFFSPVSVAIDLVQTGKVRAVALAGTERNPVLPDVPTFAEAGLPSFTYDAWFALLAPAKTPRPIVEKISRDVARLLQMPEFAARLSSQGVQAASSTPEQLDELIRTETAQFSQMIKETIRK
jgi:tripartite-type tricarboxylate transporter receptor subunit TctC